MCWALSPLSRGIWAFKIMPTASVAVGKDLRQNPCWEKAVGLKSTLKRCKSNTTPVENRIFSSENATICTVLVLAHVVMVYLFLQALLYQARTTPLLNSTPTLHFPLKSNFRGVFVKKTWVWVSTRVHLFIMHMFHPYPTICDARNPPFGA